MTTLLADYDGGAPLPDAAKALTAACALGAPVHVLVTGKDARSAADAAARLDGVAKVLLAGAPASEGGLAAFTEAGPAAAPAPIKPVDTAAAAGDLSRLAGEEVTASERTDLGSARIVVSGGRALGSKAKPRFWWLTATSKP